MTDPQQPSSPYQVTPDPQQPPRRRSVARTVFGWILIAIGVLALLGRMAAMTSGNAAGAANSAEAAGQLFGALLIIVLPLVVGILLLRRPKA